LPDVPLALFALIIGFGGAVRTVWNNADGLAFRGKRDSPHLPYPPVTHENRRHHPEASVIQLDCRDTPSAWNVLPFLELENNDEILMVIETLLRSRQQRIV
jgi:hypothetical protein